VHCALTASVKQDKKGKIKLSSARKKRMVQRLLLHVSP